MTDKRSDVLRQPLWISALLTSTDRVAVDPELQHRLHWGSGRASLCFTNAGRVPVFIPALRVTLRAGAKVDVLRPPGATGYELQVHRPSHREPPEFPSARVTYPTKSGRHLR